MGNKKVLFVATVVKKHINVFHLPYLKMFKDMGYTTFVAAKNDFDSHEKCIIPYCDNYIDVQFDRNPLKLLNIKAYNQIKSLIQKEKFDIIHCHTPTAGFINRLAARKFRKKGVKVIYTAHGFHFYKGAPLKNWLMYYPIEKLCSYWTDVLITINREDYALAKNKLHAKKVEYVPGVGIDVDKFAGTVVDVSKKRMEIGIPENAFMLLSVGELNKNKNHEVVIRAIAKLENKNIHYAIAGKGELHDYLLNLAIELGISEQLHLLGYRVDIAELYKASNVFIHPSFREGLPVSIMEAMASGLPVVCSKIRGNVDLIDENGGAMIHPYQIDEFKVAVQNMLGNKFSDFGLYNQKKIEPFSLNVVQREMQNLYAECYKV